MMGTDSFGNIASRHPRPRTKRLLVNGAADYKTVEVRPDMTVIMKDALLHSRRSRIGIAFLTGEPPRPFDYTKASLSLAEGSLPIAHQDITCRGIHYRQTVWTHRQRIYIRLEARNTGKREVTESVWLSLIRAEHRELYEIENEDYLPFSTKAEPWLKGVPLRLCGNFLYEHDRTALYFRSDGAEPEYTPDGVLRFSLSIRPGETRWIGAVVPYECLGYIEPAEGQQQGLLARERFIVPASQAQTLMEPSFDTAYEQALRDWRAYAARGMRITVAEPAAQRAFDALKLSCLQMLAKPPESDIMVPGQGGYNDFSHVYGWESSFMLHALDFLGFPEYTKRVLDYFVSIQGKRGPDGDIRSIEGTFRPSIHWMSETGSILGAFGRHYRLTRDAAFLERAADAMRAACEWIRRERAASKEYAGERPRHYGLLPRGRVHDWPDRGYFFFSDCNTYAGLREAAEAFAAAGLPDAGMWKEEAEDYRRCILDAFDRATYTLPDGGKFFASEVYAKPGPLMTSYGLDGPLSLIACGLLDAEDPRVSEIESSLRKLGLMDDLFACRLPKMEDEGLETMLLQKAGGPYSLYYVTTGEMAWHRAWLQRGETEKARDYLYATLAFALACDSAACAERYCPELPWLLPWQPNGSGNGRVLSMLRDALFYEQNDVLHLLPGVPEQWLQTEQGLCVEKGVTPSAGLDFTARSTENGLELSLTLRRTGPLSRVAVHAGEKIIFIEAADGETKIIL